MVTFIKQREFAYMFAIEITATPKACNKLAFESHTCLAKRTNLKHCWYDLCPTKPTYTPRTWKTRKGAEKWLKANRPKSFPIFWKFKARVVEI